MPLAVEPTDVDGCRECGEVVAADATFCPACGARQTTPRPRRPPRLRAESRRLERSTHLWLLTALGALALLLLVVGIFLGRLATRTTSTDGAGGDSGAAAQAMDTYAPIAETWLTKHDDISEEANDDDANGLAAAAQDARLWIEVNRQDLGVLAATPGGSAVHYQRLVAVFDTRAALLADIEAVATTGGGAAATSTSRADLYELDRQTEALTCEIAEVMRAEGDDPDAHITPDMHVAC
jgi:hypothetical protein